MFEKMLIALDGSETAETAVPYAAELSARLGHHVTLILVSEKTKDPYRHMHQAYLTKSAEMLTQTIDQLSKKYKGPPHAPVKAEFLVGHPPERIVDYAEKEGVGLIVMSTHGLSGIKRWAVGSVAEKVARATRRPVLLVRAKEAGSGQIKKRLLTRVLVPLDGTKEGESVLPMVKELGTKLSVEVTLFGLMTPKYDDSFNLEKLKRLENYRATAADYLKKAADRLKKKGFTVKTELRETLPGGEAASIIKMADETRAELVVMSTYGKFGISRWALGSVAESVLQDGNTPILLVRPD
jgi:nucleotide-binding universal stress UspA family protein